MSEKDGERFIVHGLPRLTSLMLLLIHLVRLQKKHPEAQRVDIAKLIYSTQFGMKSFNLNVAERNACLQALIDGQSPDPTDRPPSVLNLVHLFADIEDIFPDELCEEFDNFLKIQSE